MYRNILGTQKDFDRIVHIKVRSTGKLLKAKVGISNVPVAPWHVADTLITELRFHGLSKKKSFF